MLGVVSQAGRWHAQEPVNFACTAGRTITMEDATAKSAGDEHVMFHGCEAVHGLHSLGPTRAQREVCPVGRRPASGGAARCSQAGRWHAQEPVNFACTAGRIITMEDATAKSAGDEHVTDRRRPAVSFAACKPST
jgi:hypothetical protein